MIKSITDGTGKEYIELVGLCDLDHEKLVARAAELGVTPYETLDDVLRDSAVEAVALFTGPAGRAGLIHKILQSGKHVLTTKPFERDADAALSVLREAKSLGLAIHANSPSPFLPKDLEQVAAWVRQFDLGRPVAARFDVWASYQENADGRWYDDADACPVAPIFRIGIYVVNDAVRLFGEAAEVRVLTSRIRTGRPTADNAQLGILFKNGCIANVFASFCVRDGDAHRNAMTLNYERGTIYRNTGPTHMAGEPSDLEMALVVAGEHGPKIAAKMVVPNYNLQFLYQWDVFYRYVRGETTMRTTSPETFAAAVRIIEAMTEAEKSGGAALVKPVSPDGDRNEPQ